MQLHRAQGDFEAAGAQLVLIGQATPRHAAHFRRRYADGVMILADEDRKSYKAIGAKVGSVGDLVGPEMLAKGLMTTVRRGVVQGRTIGHPAQLGAAMVIVPGDEVVFSHLARNAADNADPEDMLAALAGSGA